MMVRQDGTLGKRCRGGTVDVACPQGGTGFAFAPQTAPGNLGMIRFTASFGAPGGGGLYMGVRAGNRGGGVAPPHPKTTALNLPQRHSHTPTPALTAWPTASNRPPAAP